MEIKFEWDERKNAINKKKHGLSFEEAALVFSDPRRYEMYDGLHSLIEKRWLAIGLANCKMVEVYFTERKDIIRIISARKADKNKMEEYFYGYGATNN